MERELAFNTETRAGPLSPGRPRHPRRRRPPGPGRRAAIRSTGCWRCAGSTDGALLAGRAGSSDGGFIESLGREIARFHGKAAGWPTRAGRDCMDRYVLNSNAFLLRPEGRGAGRGPVTELEEASRAAFERLEPMLAARGAQGLRAPLPWRPAPVQHHGRARPPVLFDCVEFNDTLEPHRRALRPRLPADGPRLRRGQGGGQPGPERLAGRGGAGPAGRRLLAGARLLHPCSSRCARPAAHRHRQPGRGRAGAPLPRRGPAPT